MALIWGINLKWLITPMPCSMCEQQAIVQLTLFPTENRKKLSVELMYPFTTNIPYCWNHLLQSHLRVLLTSDRFGSSLMWYVS